jgi:hypothetical protein
LGLLTFIGWQGHWTVEPLERKKNNKYEKEHGRRAPEKMFSITRNNISRKKRRRRRNLPDA